MLITTKTVISFRIPEECQMLEWFRAQHPDLIELVTSQYVGFIKQETYAVETKEEDTECEKN
jgi:hypothetical protein